MFITRLISGIILLIVAIGMMGVGGIPLALTLLVISLIAYRELTKALRCATDDKKLNGLEVIGLLGVFGLYAAVFFGYDSEYYLMCIVAVFMAEMFWYVITFPQYKALL